MPGGSGGNMDAVVNFSVLRFISWIASRHPEIRRLSDLDDDQFLRLAVEFEPGAFSGMSSLDDPGLRRHWIQYLRARLKRDKRVKERVNELENASHQQ